MLYTIMLCLQTIPESHTTFHFFPFWKQEKFTIQKRHLKFPYILYNVHDYMCWVIPRVQQQPHKGSLSHMIKILNSQLANERSGLHIKNKINSLVIAFILDTYCAIPE